MEDKKGVADDGVDIVVAINNDLMLMGIEKYLVDKQLVKGVFAHRKLNAVNKRIAPDILIFSPEEKEDFDEIQVLMEKFPEMKTVLLCSESRFPENFIFAESTKMDAFVAHNIELNVLYDIIQRFRDGKPWRTIYYPKELLETPLNKDESERMFFSDRELEVLHYVAQGKTNMQVGKILRLSYKTIESHRRRMIERMEAANIIPVILYAYTYKYIPLMNSI